MNTYKNILRLMGSLLLAGATLLGCSKETGRQEKAPAGPIQYSINLSTNATKAIVDPNDGTGTLTVTWKEGDKVSVYNKTTETEYKEQLEAQSGGVSTVLKGTFSGSFNVGDELELTFIGKTDAVQNGLLNSEDDGVTTIENAFDWAEATITVKEIQIDEEAGEAAVVTDDAYFERQQAIVKFTLLDSDETPAPLKVDSLSIQIGDDTEHLIAVKPAEAASILYVAIPAFEAKKLTLTAVATVENEEKSYKITSPEETFVNGAFYTRTVYMKPAVEVLDATTTAWADGNSFQTPDGGLTYSDAVTISGNVTLTLPAGTTLTFNGGLELACGATLTIEGEGAMEVFGTKGDDFDVSGSNHEQTAGGGIAAICGCETSQLVVNSGTVTATGGNGGDITSWENTWGMNCKGGNGGAGIAIPLTVNGGTLTAIGGSGGSHGSSYGGTDGSAGRGISSTWTAGTGVTFSDSADGIDWTANTGTSSTLKYVKAVKAE